MSEARRRSAAALAKKLLRGAGQVLAIMAITLALDFVLTATLFSRLNQVWLDAQAGNDVVYIPAPHHHDLMPNVKNTRIWGTIVFPWETDRYGFRTGACAPHAPEKNRENIFVVGDSFTEGLGTSYEQSFVGLMACDAARHDKAVWNLGVASYSPIIYHRKIEAAAERLGVKPAEIYVFLDLSDIDDDANVYRVADDGTVTYAQVGRAQANPWFDPGRFALNNFSAARLAYDLYLTSTFSAPMSLGRSRARWTVDPGLLESWGRRGLATAAANLDKVVSLCRDWQCRVTLVVYPWPDSVVAGDRDGIQVTYWRAWAAQRNVRFVDGFAPFFREPAETALGKYFITGDVHYTELGNRLLYDAVKSAIAADCSRRSRVTSSAMSAGTGC